MQDDALQDVDTIGRRPHDRRVCKTFATATYMQGGPTAADKVKAYTQLPARYYSPDDECMKAPVEGFAKAQNFVMSFMRTSTKASISVLKPEDLSPTPSSPSSRPCGNSWNSRHSSCERNAEGPDEVNSEPTAFLQSDDDQAESKAATSPAAPDRCAWQKDRCIWNKDGPASPHRARRKSVQAPGSQAPLVTSTRRSIERKPAGLVSFSVRLDGDVSDEEEGYLSMRSSKSCSRLASSSSSRTRPSADGQAEQGAVEDWDREQPGQLRPQTSSQDFTDADNETQRLMAKAFGSLHRLQSTTSAGIEAKKEKLGVYRQNAALPFNAYDWGCKNSYNKLADLDSPARFKGKHGGAKPNILLGGIAEQPAPRKSSGPTPEPLCLDDLMEDYGKGCRSSLSSSYLRSPDPMKSKLVDDPFDFPGEEATSPKLSAASCSLRSPDPMRSRSSVGVRGDWDGGGSPRLSALAGSMRSPEPSRSSSSLASPAEGSGRPGTQQEESGMPPVRCKSSMELTSGSFKAASSPTPRRSSMLRPKCFDLKGPDGYEDLISQSKLAVGSGVMSMDQVSLPSVQKTDQEPRARRGSFLRMLDRKRGSEKGPQARELGGAAR